MAAVPLVRPGDPRMNDDHIARDQLATDLLDITGIDPEMPQFLDPTCAREADAPAGTVIMKSHCVLIQWREPNVKSFWTHLVA